MLKRKSSTRFATFWKGFSLIELIVTIAIMAVLTAVLTPSLVQYTERARAQVDVSATDEMTNAVVIGMVKDEVYEELMLYSEPDNVSCYVDAHREGAHLKSRIDEAQSQYSFSDAARTVDETPYYAAGNMCGVTITFEPNENSGNYSYILEDGIINKFMPSGGQKLSELPNLCEALILVVGEELNQISATYRNSEYTIFINIGDESEDIKVYGQYDGTNLPEDVERKGRASTCDHNSIEIVGAIDATCTTSGFTGDVICMDCEGCLDDGEVIPPMGHSEILVNTIEVTCTNDGYAGDIMCERCGELLKQGEVIPILEHDVKIVEYIAPLCEEGRTEGKICEGCGLVIEQSVVIPALGHNYVADHWEWDGFSSTQIVFVCSACGHMNNVSATIEENTVGVGCETVGERTYIATVIVDGMAYTDSKKEAIEPLGHDYESTVVAPTCTEQGYTVHTCTRCGKYYKDAYTEATGHTPGTAATCTKNQVCVTCGETLANQLGHDYKAVVTNPTCAAEGYTTHTCSRCGDSYKDAHTAKTNHTSIYGGTSNVHTKCSVCNTTLSGTHTYASNVVTAATCTTKGTTKYTCVCGYNYTAQDIAINPNNHTGSSINGGSNNVHTKYSCCGATISSAHIYSSKVTTAATCTANGVRTYTCGCGHAYTESLAATGHTSTYGGTSGVHTKCSTCGTTLSTSHSYSYSTVSYASCTSSGTGKYSCACGYYYTTTISAYGHSYSSSVTTAATCTSNGVRTYKCSCGSSYTESIPATGHTPGAAATCTAAQTCTKCSATIVSATGHNYSEATCTTAKTCSKCGATSGSVPGHSWVAATCTEPKTCSRCGTTSGTKNGHSYSDATCTTPKTCSACGKTSGEKLGHSYSAATCTTPQTCSRCSKTKGDATGHSWSAATCTSPKTCSKCSATSGSKLGHSWNSATCTKAKTCSRCGTTSGSALGHNKGAAATCGMPQTCTRCSYVYQAALGHRWLADPKTGKTTCNRCGESYAT